MKQTLKIAIPIVLLMAVIFGITFFSQYTPQPNDEGGKATAVAQPLVFFSSARQWHPFSSVQDRYFPGFYEVQANAAGKPNAAAFWFENRNDKSVTMQLKGITCTTCSAGRVAPIPPEVTRELLQMFAVSNLPGGLVSGFPLGMAGPAAHLADERLIWQSYVFNDHPKAEYKIPAGGNVDGWSPQWGILELRFSVGAVGPKELKSEFDLQIDGTQQVGSANFLIVYEGVEPVDISRGEIDVGELEETSMARQYDVIVYSATRGPNGNGPGDLLVPAVDVQMPAGVLGEPGPFISVNTPVRLPESELLMLPLQIKKAVRVEAAYRITVTVTPKVGEQRIDLGPLERDIHITAADTRKTLRVKGRVKGSVWLDDNLTGIDLGLYPSSGPRGGISGKQYTVVTDRPDAELKLVPDPATPDFLVIALEKQSLVTDRGHYKLKVNVPPGKKSGGWSGSIVLEVKGPKPQRIRIPVKGTGTQ